METCLESLDKSTVDSLSAGAFSEEQARELFQLGEEAVVFAILLLSKELAEAQVKLNPSASPSTPSGMVPVYEKPAVKGRGRRNRARRKATQARGASRPNALTAASSIGPISARTAAVP